MPPTGSLVVPPSWLNIVSDIEAFRGTWQVLGNIAPERLSALRRVATIESAGSSTRIEGSSLTDRDVDRLLRGATIERLTSRDEQEVLGYAETMELVFDSWSTIPVSEASIRQLHRFLLAHDPRADWHRGHYKASPNSVTAFDAQRRHIGVILETAPPVDTPRRMAELVAWFNTPDDGLHPLPRIGVFVAVFLEIHPFQAGNGRLSRILATLLLFRSGYGYLPLSSLESVIEQLREEYYRALNLTQRTLHSGAPDWTPWLDFFLHALQQQVARLRIKVERERLLADQVPARSRRILDHARNHGRVTIGEMVALTGASRNTLKPHFRSLIAAGRLTLHGAGRGAWYGPEE